MRDQQRPEVTDDKAKPLIGEAYLAGDLTSAVMSILRNQTEIFNLKPKREQQEEKDRVTHTIKKAVREAVAIIAAQGAPKLDVTIDGASLKTDAIKITLTLPKSSKERHALFDAIGTGALLVLPQYALALEGAGARDKPDPQQSIPLDQAAPTTGDGGEPSDPDEPGAAEP